MDDSIKCANCGKAIPASARACLYCEALTGNKPSHDEKSFIREMLGQMDPDTLRELQDVISSSKTAEEFINNIFVGSCPNCESANTGDCENDPDVENPLIGYCLECGCHWCTECDRIFEGKDPTKMECPCWDEEMPGMEMLE